ncbi:MAG: hypothetical protein ACRYFS_06880 [Janthinobacterium lividum]
MSVVSEAQASQAESVPPPVEKQSGALKRFGFRLLFAYVLFYLLPPFMPGSWDWLVTWAGQDVFHTEVATEFTSSGDTSYQYVLEACRAALALATALIWTPFDRGRKADVRLGEWLRVAVRFALAMQMLVYGIMKVVPTQFSTPGLMALAEPLGSHSPMGLLWAFMGTSTVYTIFAGFVEVMGGLLLLSRRTTLLGALVSIVAMGNVVALNFCYDVPVKLFSSHLLLLAALLTAPDVGRLADIFLLNRPVLPAVLRPHSVRRWVNWTLLGVKTLAFTALIGSTILGDINTRKSFASAAPKPPLYGIWNADEPAQTGLPEADRWRQVAVEFPGIIGVTTADGTFQYYRASVDQAHQTWTLTSNRRKGWSSRLTYTQIRPGQIMLRGTFGSHLLQATLTQMPDTRPPLLSRGFHWISPVPFNR